MSHELYKIGVWLPITFYTFSALTQVCKKLYFSDFSGFSKGFLVSGIESVDINQL